MDVFYTVNKHQEKLAGYISDYKIKGDSLFLYEPKVKRWCATYVTMSAKDHMEISNRREKSRTDTHYQFMKVGK